MSYDEVTFSRKRRSSVVFHHGCNLEVDPTNLCLLKDSCDTNLELPWFGTTSQILCIIEAFCRHIPNCDKHLGIAEHVSSLSKGHSTVRCASQHCPIFGNPKSLPHSSYVSITVGNNTIRCKKIQAQVIFSFMSQGILLEPMRKSFENLSICFGDSRMYEIGGVLALGIVEFTEDLINQLCETYTEGKHDVDCDGRWH